MNSIYRQSIGITCYGCSTSCDVILDLMFAFSLEQVVKEPTRENSILDLLFVSQKFNKELVQIESGISDHYLLRLE